MYAQHRVLRFPGFPVATNQCGNRQVSVSAHVQMHKRTHIGYHWLFAYFMYIIYLNACPCHTLSIIVSPKHTIYMAWMVGII